MSQLTGKANLTLIRPKSEKLKCKSILHSSLILLFPCENVDIVALNTALQNFSLTKKKLV